MRPLKALFPMQFAAAPSTSQAVLLELHERTCRGGDGQRLVSELTSLSHRFPTSSLGALFPMILVDGEQEIRPVELKTRSANVLEMKGADAWSKLAMLSIADLRRLPNSGRVTLRDVLGACVRRSYEVSRGLGRASPNVDATCAYPQGQPEPANSFSSLEEPLATLAAWSQGVNGGRRLRDIMTCAVPEEQLPSEVRDAVQRLGDSDLEALRESSGISFDMPSLLRELLSTLTDGERTAFEKRALADKAPTLECVGQELGVSRERVRQLCVSAENRIGNLLRDRRFMLLRWRAVELRRRLGTRARIGDEPVSSALDDALAGCSDPDKACFEPLILRLAGPYDKEGGWLVRHDAPRLDLGLLDSFSDENGVLNADSLRSWLTNSGLDRRYHEQWINDCSRIRRFDDELLLWSGNAVDKCVAVLAVRGTPATAGELLELMGEDLNARGVRVRLINDNRVMRTDRDHLALRKWGMEEYSGIAAEIEQRIREQGGCASMPAIVEELVTLFGVSEYAVRLYASAPLFVTDQGRIRLRGDDEPYVLTGTISECRGVFAMETQGRWSILIAVDKETLRGSGRAFPGHLASVLGVTPGKCRTFISESGPISLTWPATNATGASIGSLRSTCSSLTAELGDYLRLCFDDCSGEVTSVRVTGEALRTLPPIEAIALATGLTLTGDPIAALGAAIGVAEFDVQRVLSERGDIDVLRMLPATQDDKQLEEALRELGDLLGGGEHRTA